VRRGRSPTPAWRRVRRWLNIQLSSSRPQHCHGLRSTDRRMSAVRSQCSCISCRQRKLHAQRRSEENTDYIRAQQNAAQFTNRQTDGRTDGRTTVRVSNDDVDCVCSHCTRTSPRLLISWYIVSAILFHLFSGNIQYQYFYRQVTS